MKRCLALALLAWAPGVAAQWAELSFVDPALRWRTLETASFAVHFAERDRGRARVVAGVAEAVLPRLTALLAWKPASRIHVVVLDSGDFANGWASPVPFNHATVFLSPPDQGELLLSRDWLALVLTHELFHLVHLDKVRGAALGLRQVFGRVPFFFPNVLQPGWIIEGLAVHAESGRLGEAHYEGMMRAEAARGFRSLSELNAGGRGFPLNREYLYGGYFFAFLEERYGRKALADFVEAYSGNVIPFRVHSNPVAATGKHMDALWAEYAAWLRARFSGERTPALEGEALARAWLLSSPALAPDGTRWYIRGDGYTRPKLVRQAPGEAPQEMREVEDDARLAASPAGDLVLAQGEICDNYNHYFDLSRIAPDGRSRRLSTCGRYRFAAPADGGRVFAVRMENGHAEVVDLAGEVLYRGSPGESITGIAARGSRVVLTSLRDGRWSLVELAGKLARVLAADGAIKHSPRIGEDGEVFFVADYGKVFDVWSARGSSLARWTRAAHGVREISAPYRGELLLTTIEADGDALRGYRLPEAPLEILAMPGDQPAPQAEASLAEATERPYSPWRSLLPRSWLPIIEVADGATKIGVITFGQDALGLHQYTLAPQLELRQGEVLGDATYVYDRRHGLFVDRSMTVNEPLSDDAGAYTIEEGAQWVSTWRHLTLERRFYWGIGGALDRERQHVVGGRTFRAQDERVLALLAGLDTRRTQWLSEGPSQGFQVRLFAETSHGLGGTYSGDVYRADSRLHFPLGRTVLSLRWNEAWGGPDAEPFQLGGSESDSGPLLPVINQREFALRGYTNGEPTLIGHRARVGTVEWRVPVGDVDRHAMVPPVGLNRVALNLFLEAGDAWPSGGEPDYHRGYGVEVMAEVRFGYRFGADLRLGLARGADDGGRTTGYLRVGRAF